ncbi:MAG: AMP-binding protein [Bacteroidales bacterium]|nr:AMP-binding protein [Bacteroidales bacterium]
MKQFTEIHHFFTYLNHVVPTCWDQPAITDYQGKYDYTYGKAAEQVAKIRLLLNKAGIQAGDHVAICSNNCANWAVAAMSITINHSVIVSLMDAFVPEDIEKLVRHSNAKAMFVSSAVWEHIHIESLPNVDLVLNTESFQLLYARTPQIEEVYQNIEQLFIEQYPNGFGKENINLPEDRLDDLMIINYTSGTTSSPKGVMLSYRNISANIQYSQETIPNKAGWTEICMLPLAHMFGFSIEFLYQVCGGCHVYFLNKKPSPTILMQAYSEVKPYMILTVPLVLEKIFRKKIFPALQKPIVKVIWNTPLLCKVIEKRIYKELMNAFGGQLIWLITGGAAVHPEVERIFRRIRFPFVVGYGLTETGPLACYAHWYNEVQGCCGTVVDRCELKIDSEDPYKIVGEIFFRGPHVMMGYYNNEEATKEILDADGWLHTGDLGVVDKQGRLFIKGRKKAMILSSNGQNIYPEEVEEKVNSLPMVEESLVVDRNGKLVALVVPEHHIERDVIEEQMKKNLVLLNEQLPKHSQIQSIEIMETEFEKTPKQSIKRFLYS